MRKFFTLFLAVSFGVTVYGQTDCSDLYFSEYIEGGSNNKAFEIYNPTSADIDLTGYGVALFSNGGTTTTNILQLSGTIASGDVYIVANSQSSTDIIDEADTTHTVTFFNGNDALALGKVNGMAFDTLDIIGVIGQSSTWTVGTGSTSDNTLVRKSSVKAGTTKWKTSVTQWDVYNKDEFGYLGAHKSGCISTGGGNSNAISIKELRTNDADGISTYDGQKVLTGGIVNNATNFGGGGGMQISFQSRGWGITTYLRSWTGYQPRVGDSIWVYGTMGKYNGLTQFTSADSIVLIDSGLSVMPEVVTTLDESTESKLVKIENLTWVDPSAWRTSGSFNMDVTNGVDTFAMRVDSDTDIDGRDAQTSSFSLVGIGGQFDGSAPHLEGYQLFPRNWWDLEFDMYEVSIEEARTNNDDEISVYSGKNIVTGGIVNNATNFGGGGGTQISFQDNGWGLTTYLRSWKGYQPRVGDSIWIYGEMGEFNGLTQFVSADSVVLKDSGLMVMPEVVTMLDESTESKLIRMENLMFVDIADWATSGSFNIDITNGVDTFAMRVDSDTDIDGRDAQNSSFSLVGVGGQFDGSAPHSSGYQIFPRNWWDIEFDLYTVSIEEARMNNEDGVSMYDGKTLATSGIVNNATNFGGGGGMQISFQDNGWGVTTYLRDWTGYQPRVGDSIVVYGELGAYNGLTQFVGADSVVLADSNKMIGAMLVDTLGEMQESYLVMFEDVRLVDTNQWKTSGSFNADFTNGTDTFALRVDSDTDIPGMEVPTGYFDIMGIGGQFDGSAPYADGYQLFPRSLTDIDVKVSIREKSVKTEIFPSPTSGILNIVSEENIVRVDVYNLVGSKVKTFNNVNTSVSLEGLNNGIYILEGFTAKGSAFTHRVVKK